MERLTIKRDEKNVFQSMYYAECKEYADGCVVISCPFDCPCEIEQALFDRLGAIEEILGDEYDLEMLKKLAQADQEGRCVILPVKPGDSVRFAKNPRAKNETVDAITIYSDGRMSFGFHEYGVKTEWVDRWSEDDACKYVPVESTKEALRREQDG